MDIYEALFDSPTSTIGAEPMRRSCKDLGLCQSRKPACGGCTVSYFPSQKPLVFAPGVIERLPHRESMSRYWIRAAAIVTMMILASAGLGLALGLALRWVGLA